MEWRCGCRATKSLGGAEIGEYATICRMIEVNQIVYRPLLLYSTVSNVKGWFDRASSGMMFHHTVMPKTKVALTLDADLLDRVDHLVARQRFRNRSQAIEAALAEKLARLARTRLAEECAKLDPAEEQRLADEGLAATRESWPEY